MRRRHQAALQTFEMAPCWDAVPRVSLDDAVVILNGLLAVLVMAAAAQQPAPPALDFDTLKASTAQAGTQSEDVQQLTVNLTSPGVGAAPQDPTTLRGQST